MKSNKDKLGNIYDELLEELVDKKHPYRKIKEIINLEGLVKPIEKTYSKVGRAGEPAERGFKALLLQYWEDLSDRQLEREFTSEIIFVLHLIMQTTFKTSYD